MVPLQIIPSGLILPQAGGLLLMFTALLFLLPASEVTISRGPGDAVCKLLVVRLIRLLLPMRVAKGLKISFYLVILLSVLKLSEGFAATIGNDLQFIWHLFPTGLTEVGVLIHLLNPKAQK